MDAAVIPLLIGDSLSVGAQPYLHSVAVDARTSRTSAEGRRRLHVHRLPSGRLLIWALGTNDSPADYRSALPSRKRLVLVTIYGTPGARAINRTIRRRVPARCVVPWGRWARRHRRHMMGVHSDAYGYRARARMTERAMLACQDG